MPFLQLEESQGPDDAGGGDRPAFKVTIFEEDTIVTGDLVDIKEKIAPFTEDDGSEIRRFEFTFRLPEYNNQRVWGETPLTFSTHPDCKLRAWVQEILGGNELPAGFRVNTDDLKDIKGLRLRLGYRKYFSKKENKNKEINPVVDVLHARSSVASSSAFDPSPF